MLNDPFAASAAITAVDKLFPRELLLGKPFDAHLDWLKDLDRKLGLATMETAFDRMLAYDSRVFGVR